MLKIIVISCILFISFIVQAQNGKWKPCKSCDNIKVEYSQISSVDYEVSINTIINANLKDIVSVIYDIESYPDWLYNCILVEDLEPIENSKGIIYALIAAPFPMKDIEMFLSYSIMKDKDKDAVVIRQNGISDYSPPNDKYQRVTRYSAIWKLVQLKDNKVGLTYYVKMGVPKNIPQLLLRIFVCSGPSSTIEEFVKSCEAN